VNRLWLPVALAAGAASAVAAQTPESPAPKSVAASSSAIRLLAESRPIPVADGQAAAASAGAPVRLTLEEAIARARKNAVPFQAALTRAAVAVEERKQARNTLLPSAFYNNSVIYTQSIGLNNQTANPNLPPVVYIANNAVHEYISQVNVHEAIDVAAVAAWRRAGAAAAAAKAQQEIAARGLVVTVVQSYFAVAAAQQKVASAGRNANEGEEFLKITRELEHGGEVAHSDVVKAELQTEARRRELREAQLALVSSRLDFAVLVFPDFTDNFEIADDLHTPVALPTMAEIEQLASRDNPDVRAALESVRQAGHALTEARAGYLPSLTVDYFYGIDAPVFAVNTVVNTTKISNLGSSIVGTLNLPVWNWGTTQSRIKRADLELAQSKRELSLAQRRLLSEIQAVYAEAKTSSEELQGLQRSAQLAEESLRLTTLRYKNGEATVLEVVDAQTTFATANAAYHDGAVRYRVALANLQTLTGAMPTP
jgi:outer membrane protein TolC